MRSFLWILALPLIGCGSGKFTVDRANADESLVEVATSDGSVTSPIGREFFQTNLFAITSTSCAKSGCHLTGDAFSEAAGAFVIDPNDFTTSWNYIGNRRTSVVDGDFTNAAAKTLEAQRSSGHHSAGNGFPEWDADQLADFASWIALTE